MIVCQECGMRNKTKRCSLCGHVNKGAIISSEKTIETVTRTTHTSETKSLTDITNRENKANTSTNRRMLLNDGKSSNKGIPTQQNDVQTKARKVIQLGIAVIMIGNILPILLTVFSTVGTGFIETGSSQFIVDSISSDELIKTESTGIYESAQFISKWFYEYLPDEVMCNSYTDFKIQLFETEYEVDARLSCYNGSWYEIYISVYDESSIELDEYLINLFNEYTNDLMEYQEEYDCIEWIIDDEIKVTAYYYQNYSTDESHLTGIYVQNYTFYDY